MEGAGEASRRGTVRAPVPADAFLWLLGSGGLELPPPGAIAGRCGSQTVRGVGAVSGVCGFFRLGVDCEI